MYFHRIKVVLILIFSVMCGSSFLNRHTHYDVGAIGGRDDVVWGSRGERRGGRAQGSTESARDQFSHCLRQSLSGSNLFDLSRMMHVLLVHPSSLITRFRRGQGLHASILSIQISVNVNQSSQK